MTEHGCIHLSNFKAAKGTQPYRVIYSYFVSCTTSEARKRKAFSCYCYVCRCLCQRLHSCLHCIFFGCFVGGHIQEHAKIKKHYLAVELTYGMIMCFQCGDYVYDRELLDIASERDAKASRALGLPIAYRPWVPTLRDIELLKAHPRRRRILENSTIGLRGLVNMGNTCFMNCIVQALVHTPMLRDFFLAEKHRCHFAEEPGLCVVCEVARLFQEFYSGDKSPVVIHRLLYFFWNNESDLAGYEQQDAHDFFMETLNVLHQHSTRDNPSSAHHCNCIIDQIFSGRLQSDLVCSACNAVSTTFDPFWDISLDLGTGTLPGSTSDTGSSAGSVASSATSQEPMSLLDCLKWFTRAEHLGEIECSSCQSTQEATKQLTMKKLPVIATFHLKRFEHSSRFRKKISTFVAFPEHLDMTPFVSHHQNMNGHCVNQSTFISNNRYSLFAVINHSGSLDVGHYTAFIRQQRNHWFKCDDQIISRANIQEVLDSEGYLLFYHKQFLEYE